MPGPNTMDIDNVPTPRDKGKGKEKAGEGDKLLDEHLPWVEKYRPSTLEDLVSQGDIVNTISNFIKEDRLPHLLFYGPPGTGKTSTILACAREMYGEKFKSMILELNASDDRGIDVVRDQIKTFASTRRMFESGVKLVILDEADAMTSAAQAALRRVIEKYTSNVRFCMICNYASKIIPALQSRCTRFRFSPLDPAHIRERLSYILEHEGVSITPEGEAALLKLAKGDMRRVLNVLQSCHAAALSGGRAIDEDAVYACTGQPHPADVERIMHALLYDEFTSAHALLSRMRAEKGMALQDLVGEIGSRLTTLEIPAPMRIHLVDQLAEIEYRLASGATERLQVTALLGAFKVGVDLAGKNQQE